ncbi:DUF3105 domain-containing protein [Conexibacter woesei]|uniref:DUF3105 domain-containing protein n=1 Tax=Conexibacter woesei (strain DSM 14684 / CCUG 47730 / CIP 108061 / JCM 11494 / NBRC 100937 / ID131577) TaxID=469383 RepID=D3FBM0_CONWI|nr:DUF3105 domain-containing protein [Conexibacter woesei]ADB49389.1 hypothetical protein Cwoe_0956 [Conexibacter woesei DSM 14684]
MGLRTDRDGVDRDGAAGISRRAVCALAAFVVGTFAICALVFGLGSSGPAPAAAGIHDGCRESDLRFTVTNDQREVDRQHAFERRLLAAKAQLPQPRFHTEPVDPTASLHSASHGFVVAYYRDDVAAGDLGDLRALQALANEQKVPLLTAPRVQRAALVAVRSGIEMTCSEAGAEQVAQLRRFTAELYRSLAEG